MSKKGKNFHKLVKGSTKQTTDELIDGPVSPRTDVSPSHEPKESTQSTIQIMPD